MSRNTRILVGLAAILFFGGRMIWTVVDDKRQKREREELLRSLPSPPPMEIEIPMPDLDLDSMRQELDRIGASLDSLGEAMGIEPPADSVSAASEP